jgi:hypothetical protein
MSWEAGFDRCYKCQKVRHGIWQGSNKDRFFTCLSCFGKWVRKLARMKAKAEEQ